MKSRSLASVLLVVLTACSGGIDALAPTPDASTPGSIPTPSPGDDAGAPTSPVVTSGDAGASPDATTPEDAEAPSPADAATYPDAGPAPVIDAGASDGAAPPVDAGLPVDAGPPAHTSPLVDCVVDSPWSDPDPPHEVITDFFGCVMTLPDGGGQMVPTVVSWDAVGANGVLVPLGTCVDGNEPAENVTADCPTATFCQVYIQGYNVNLNGHCR